MSPQMSLFALSAFLIMGSANWRKRRIRRAVRDLPTRAQRQLGPDPYFDPPEHPDSEALQSYANLHRRSLRIVHVCWALAFVWLAYVLYLLAGGPTQ